MPLPPSRVVRPTLTNPTVATIGDSTTGQYVTKSVTGDAQLYMSKNRTSGVAVLGGTHVIVQGSTMTLSNPGPLLNGKWDLAQMAYYRRAGTFNNQDDVAGAILHVEGLWAKGSTLSEGCQTISPATVQFVYCRFDHLIEQDWQGDTDNHSDMVQNMRADRGVRVSWCACVTDLQGMMLKWETSLSAKPYAFYEIDNTLFHGGQHGDFLLNMVSGFYSGTKSRFENVCLIPSADKLATYGGDVATALGHSVAPSISSASDPATVTRDPATGFYKVTWPTLEANGTVTQVGNGVYYDPAIAAMSTAAALEAWLPAALIGDNYVPPSTVTPPPPPPPPPPDPAPQPAPEPAPDPIPAPVPVTTPKKRKRRKPTLSEARPFP